MIQRSAVMNIMYCLLINVKKDYLHIYLPMNNYPAHIGNEQSIDRCIALEEQHFPAVQRFESPIHGYGVKATRTDTIQMTTFQFPQTA